MSWVPHTVHWGSLVTWSHCALLPLTSRRDSYPGLLAWEHSSLAMIVTLNCLDWKFAGKIKLISKFSDTGLVTTWTTFLYCPEPPTQIPNRLLFSGFDKACFFYTNWPVFCHWVPVFPLRIISLGQFDKI